MRAHYTHFLRVRQPETAAENKNEELVEKAKGLPSRFSPDDV